MVNDWKFTECVKYQMAEEQRSEMEGRIEEIAQNAAQTEINSETERDEAKGIMG